MTEYLRVRDKETGHHLSIPRTQFDRDPDVWQELKQPATYPDGSPLPPKHRTSVDESAEKKNTTAGQSADSKKEN